MKRFFLVMNLILLAILVAGCSSNAEKLELTGMVETSVISHYSQVSGKIIEMPVELGQDVKAGDVVAKIDDSNERHTLNQLQTVLAKKQAMMSDLLGSIDPAEIKQAENNVLLAEKALESAELTNELAKKAFEKAQKLFEAGGLSEADWDQAKYKAEQAAIDITVKKVQLDNARQKLMILQKGVTQAKVDSLQAEIDQTNSQISQIEENLSKYKITALSDGIVISKNYLLGNIIAPGYNLADVASDTDKYLVAYLPEEHLPRIDYKQEVTITTGKGEQKGIISFIDVKAQYTPKEMQTAANKNKDSIKIKVRLDRDTSLKVGEKATLIITK
ncbi:MAG: HlyD family efflux transporter periplasmic adaptor subunit [Syntrophomonadaceae bacterium]|jgi:HlyD family secretion protein|nr:HlyD family efflux transporter periplasmic adaptor subunit [Syntrophomonadaceae bacterium]